MKRKLLIGTALAALAVLLYAAAGYWLAPRLARDALHERAAALGIALAIEEVRTDPFRLTLELSGISLTGPDGARLARAQGLELDFAWASLWSDAWIVERAALQAPQLEVVLGPQGALNWPRPAAGGGEGAGEGAALRVQALSISEGALHFVDRSRAAPVDLALQQLELVVRNLATHEGEAQYRLRASVAGGGALSSDGTFSLAPRAAHGELGLSKVALSEAWKLAAPSSDPGRGELSAHAMYAYEEGRLVLHDVQAEASAVAYAGLAASRVTLEAPRLAVPPQQPVQLSARAQLEPRGSLAASGKLTPQPFSANLSLEADSVALALAQRFLPDAVKVDIASGSVSGKGNVELGKGRARYQGGVEVSELRLEERESQRLLLGWERARTDALTLAVSPTVIDLGEVAVRAPQGRLVIEQDGRVNFGEAFKPGDGQGSGAALKASVRRLRLEQGSLYFADRSLETPFEVTMRELGGTVTGFSTEPGDPALVEASGRVGEFGSVRIDGNIDLDEPKSLANITARFENVGLAQLTPYVVKFAGYRVRSGRVSADLRYRVREGDLSGRNELVFRELQLGEKVAGSGAPDLPLELAVALLSDAKGRIRLDIPVRGDLNDPKFDFGGLVARALGNAIGKIVSAPFRALAALFDGEGGEKMNEVRFAAGSAQLSPPQEESVAKVAQALAQRPRLGVAVRGGFDPERDAAALRRDTARREIARRAGFEPAGPLDFSDPKTLRAAERLYLERIGNRENLKSLRAKEARYGHALLELLAYTLPQDAGNAQRLARERAQAVRAALVERGVAPSRVALEAPTEQAAEEEGVPTQLALNMNVNASLAQGAQRSADAPELVREAQRRLRAEGFAPGPADGKLGPQTASALRSFQQARGLEASGALDARTLSALGVAGDAAVGASAAR